MPIEIDRKVVGWVKKLQGGSRINGTGGCWPKSGMRVQVCAKIDFEVAQGDEGVGWRWHKARRWWRGVPVKYGG